MATEVIAMLSCVIGAAAELIKCVGKPVGRRFSQLIHSRDKFDTLKRKLEELKNKRDDIKHELEAAELQGKKPTNQVKWSLERVETLEREVQLMAESYLGGNKMCFGGCCLDCLSIYRLGKNSAKKLHQVDEVMERLQHFDKLVATPPPEPVEEKMATSLGNQPTTQQTIEEILCYLQDEQIRTIGIYGMGGVGKSTLMKHVNNKIPHGLFSCVIWVTVSRNMDLRDVQNQISKRLKITLLDIPHEEERGKPIFERLRRNKYLLLLDDVWEELNLDKIGVPTVDKEGGNGCKIVLTTRSVDVCNAMLVDEMIKVDVLPSDEAWDLFRNIAGDVVLDPSIEPIAKQVTQECGGLPLAIITIGKAMRDKITKEVWLNALRALREASPTEIRGMERHVFQCLKFSYESLKDENLRSCFLYFCLFPEDLVSAEDLEVRWVAEGLVEHGGNLENSLNKGFAVLENLKDACLLETDYIDESLVRMHDLIDDMGRWITSPSRGEGPKFLIKNKMRLTEIPEEEEWREVERISLARNKFKNLPEQPDCRKLLTLFLSFNTSLEIIPSRFFEHMHALRVLDLSYTKISSLPSSVCDLGNLRSLRLFGCGNLAEMPPLGGLHELQVLVLEATGIQELPEGLEGLSKLKILNLNFTKKLKKVQTNKLGELTCLEHLFMLNKTSRRRKRSYAWSKVDLEAVARLKQLKRLHITIKDAATLEWLLGSVLLDRTKDLDVSCEDAYIEGIWSRGANNLNGLEFLEISLSSKIEKIIIEDQDMKGPCFKSLKELRLFELPQLYRIWGGHQMPDGSFGNLQVIDISECGKLKYLFACHMLQHLQNLTDVNVRSCPEMEVLIHGQVAEGDALPNLEFLDLYKLPKLRTLCESILDLWSFFPSLDELYADDCPMLIL